MESLDKQSDDLWAMDLINKVKLSETAIELIFIFSCLKERDNPNILSFLDNCEDAIRELRYHAFIKMQCDKKHKFGIDNEKQILEEVTALADSLFK